MSAIVVGTYVCALYGAFGTPVRAAKPSGQPRPGFVTGTTRPAAPAAATTQPNQARLTGVADVSNAR